MICGALVIRLKSEMTYSQISQNHFLIRLFPGEEVIDGLKKFGQQLVKGVAFFSAIGAAENIELNVYDKTKKNYIQVKKTEPHELLTLTGNIARKDDGELIVHAHALFSNQKMEAFGGHLTAATITATAEILVELFEKNLVRRLDPNVGLSLFDLESKIDTQ